MSTKKGPTSSSPTSTSEASAIDSSGAAAERGATLFRRSCATCHTATKDGGHRQGPNLFGVVGRAAGSAPGFGFSASSRGSHVTWTEDNLFEYLEKPKRFMPGTSMTFDGIRPADKRRDLIAFLKSLTS